MPSSGYAIVFWVFFWGLVPWTAFGVPLWVVVVALLGGGAILLPMLWKDLS